MSAITFKDPFVAEIRITPTSAGKAPDVKKDGDVVTCVDGPAVWFIFNYDQTTDYLVEIDYDEILNTTGGGKKKEHPFPKSKTNHTTVDAANGSTPGKAALVDVIKHHTPKTKKDTYTYKVTVSKGSISKTIDPDIEVVDPFPLIIEAK